MPNDSMPRTLAVATGVCVACSLLVSGAAVTLQPIQQRNRDLDRKRNVLLAAGLIEEGQQADIDRLFEQIDARLVDLDTGQFVADVPAEDFDLATAQRDPRQSRALPSADDPAGIRRRPNRQVVYLVREDDKLHRLVLPVYGNGLWSTMYGLIALEGDLNTVASFGFFAHGETPGLGGEVDNPRWKARWLGKKAFDADGNPCLQVVKGSVADDATGAEHQVDGLSGATLTGRGVTNLLHFWLSEQGYGPLLDRLRAEAASGHDS